MTRMAQNYTMVGRHCEYGWVDDFPPCLYAMHVLIDMADLLHETQLAAFGHYVYVY